MQTEDRKWQVSLAAVVIGVILVVIASALLTSCKAVQKYKGSPDFARDCAISFPPRTSIQYLPGDTVVTVYEVPGDTLFAFDTITVEGKPTVMPVSKPCPKVLVKEVSRVDTIVKVVENTASVVALQQENAVIRAANERLEQDNDRLRYRSGVLLLIIVAGCISGGVFLFRKPLLKLLS